jgi:hypothetical protein
MNFCFYQELRPRRPSYRSSQRVARRLRAHHYLRPAMVYLTLALSSTAPTAMSKERVASSACSGCSEAESPNPTPREVTRPCAHNLASTATVVVDGNQKRLYGVYCSVMSRFVLQPGGCASVLQPLSIIFAAAYFVRALLLRARLVAERETAEKQNVSGATSSSASSFAPR